MMYRILALSAIPALLLVTAPAGAGDPNKRLHGDYAVGTTSICAQAQTPFNPQGQALGPVNPLTRIIDTTRTYNGDGTMSIVGRSLQINGTSTTVGSFPMSESEFTCAGTYQVNEDNSFSETTQCSGNVLTGFNAGQTFINSPSTFRGQIRGKTLVFKDTQALADPQTVTVSGPTTTTVFFRLCGAAGTGVKIDH